MARKDIARRPFWVGSLPLWVEGFVYYRFFKPLPAKYHALYQCARLRFAPDVVVTLPPGTDYMYESLALLGWYERELSKVVCTLARRGGVMIDVGANVGYFSVLWLHGHPENRVFCYEPSPLVIPYLTENLERNGLSKKATIREKAAASECGSVLFDARSSAATGWGSLVSEAGNHTFAVGSERIDDALDPDIEIAFMKIDVEGAEMLVLEGCKRLLQQHKIKQIYFEQNKPGAASLGLPPEGAQSLLRSLGYRLEPFGRKSDTEIQDWWATAD